MVRIDIDRTDNTAKMLGYETGKLIVAQETVLHLVLHEQYSTHWVGIGIGRGSSPSQYRVFKIIERTDEPDATYYTANELLNFPVRPIKTRKYPQEAH